MFWGLCLAMVCAETNNSHFYPPLPDQLATETQTMDYNYADSDGTTTPRFNDEDYAATTIKSLDISSTAATTSSSKENVITPNSATEKQKMDYTTRLMANDLVDTTALRFNDDDSAATTIKSLDISSTASTTPSSITSTSLFYNKAEQHAPENTTTTATMTSTQKVNPENSNNLDNDEGSGEENRFLSTLVTTTVENDASSSFSTNLVTTTTSIDFDASTIFEETSGDYIFPWENKNHNSGSSFIDDHWSDLDEQRQHKDLMGNFEKHAWSRENVTTYMKNLKKGHARIGGRNASELICKTIERVFDFCYSHEFILYHCHCTSLNETETLPQYQHNCSEALANNKTKTNWFYVQTEIPNCFEFKKITNNCCFPGEEVMDNSCGKEVLLSLFTSWCWGVVSSLVAILLTTVYV